MNASLMPTVRRRGESEERRSRARRAVFAVGRAGRNGHAGRGLAHLEIIASLGLTIALGGLFAAATLHYAAMRRENDTRRMLQLAAAAELDLIRAGLHAVPATDAQAEATEPDRPAGDAEIALAVRASPGQGQWSGMTLVRVAASKRVGVRRVIQIELAAYMAGEERR